MKELEGTSSSNGQTFPNDLLSAVIFMLRLVQRVSSEPISKDERKTQRSIWLQRCIES